MGIPVLRLFLKSPGAEERVYAVEPPGAVIGRDPQVDLPVRDKTLSRHHCRVYLGPDGWRISDLGSRNGTFLNGAPILDAPLGAGDLVELGETRVAAYLASEDGEVPPPHTLPQTRRHGPSDRPRENRALTHILELNEKINALRDEDQLLEGILDAAIELTEASRGFLLIKEDDHFTVRRARLPDHRDLEDPYRSLSVGIATRVIETGRSIVLADALSDERVEAMESVATLELRSLVCVPLKGSKGTLGAIYLDNPHERGSFDAWDVRVLEGFSSLASIAIRNARQRREMAARRREAVRQSRRIERLNERLKKALRIRTNALRQAREGLAKQADEHGLRYRYDQIVGRSPGMRAVLRLVDRVTDLDLPVLIVGESGTGKELIARAIHFNGPRRRSRFVGENCAALPESLVESELFGYQKGAFTGAARDHAGLFEQANQGTLFLDEIGELSPEVQKKFLRVLEERAVRRIGSKETVAVDFRLVSATNRDLQGLLASGLFREDLYYRIAGVVIELPPLRDRREDVPPLVARFIEELAPPGLTLRVQPAALDLLVAYEWPGNVRELRNEVQRLIALESGGEIRPEHLSARLLAYRQPDAAETPAGRLKDLVEDLERRMLRASLLRHGWNKSRAATELGLSRLGLRKKLERYGMDSEEPA